MRQPYSLRLLAVLVPLLLANGPCGPITGGRLSGPVAAEPVADWGFVADVSTIAVETKPDDPLSVTTWCVTDGPTLYVPSRNAANKAWVQNATANPNVRLQIGDTLYERRAVRVNDDAERARVIAMMRDKYSMARWFADPDPAQSPDTWFFRMEPRQ